MIMKSIKVNPRLRDLGSYTDKDGFPIPLSKTEYMKHDASTILMPHVPVLEFNFTYNLFFIFCFGGRKYLF